MPLLGSGLHELVTASLHDRRRRLQREQVAGAHDLQALTRRIAAYSDHTNLPQSMHAVAHVIDRVLLPARTLQQVLPYSQAVGGLAGGGSGGGASAAITGAGPAGDAVSAALAAGGTGAATTLPGLTGLGQAPAGQQQQCFRSIADAIAATPSLSIVRSTLSLSGVSAGMVALAPDGSP